MEQFINNIDLMPAVKNIIKDYENIWRDLLETILPGFISTLQPWQNEH